MGKLSNMEVEETIEVRPSQKCCAVLTACRYRGVARPLATGEEISKVFSLSMLFSDQRCLKVYQRRKCATRFSP